LRYPLTGEFESVLGIEIRERGKNSMVRCPFHEDRTPSLSLDLVRGLFICFQCGEKGTIEYLAARLNKPIDPTAAVRQRLEYVEPERQDFSSLAERLHEQALRARPKAIVEYILGRGLDPEAFRHFRLGWDGSRISMPYYDGATVPAVRYRGPGPRKSFEEFSRRCIYNVNDIRGAESVILCEGESDTHAVWSRLASPGLWWYNVGVAGIPGVGQGQPSQETWELWLLDLMGAKRVYIAFDADDAGDAGAIIPMAILGDKAVRVRPTKGKDMAEHLMNGGTLSEAGLDAPSLQPRLADEEDELDILPA
jgi:DNA primase